jgi:hypothetical protein
MSRGRRCPSFESDIHGDRGRGKCGSKGGENALDCQYPSLAKLTLGDHPAHATHPDAIPPKFEITGAVPVTATIAPTQATASVAKFPDWKATDAVDKDPTVTCKAPLNGAAPVVVTDEAAVPGTPATAFPYGVTVVTCTAADDENNVSPAASFAVIVNCTAGYPFRDGACQSE